MPQLKAFSLTFRCQNVSALPKGFGVQELKIQQSDLLFEHSRCAVRAERADSSGRLVPCGAGKRSRLDLPRSNFSPESGLGESASSKPRKAVYHRVVNNVGVGDTHTGSGLCSV